MAATVFAAGGVALAAEAMAPMAEGTLPSERQQFMDAAVLEPRRIAAAVVAAAKPTPRRVVQVGAHQGEFLDVFMERFPASRATWIEAVTSKHNQAPARQRLARLGERVDFRFGCARRDLGPGCQLPEDTDVVIIEWLSIQQTLAGMQRIFGDAAAKLPVGGWIVHLDHVTFTGQWQQRMATAVQGFRRPEWEGPPVHYPQFRVPTKDEQLAALRGAGFDAEVVWQSFSTILIVGQKK
jgi:hypothetical protein